MSVLDKNIRCLQEKMSALNESLQNNRALHQNYDVAIRETEIGFKKVRDQQSHLQSFTAAFVTDFREQSNVVTGYSARY